ncbi:hypothetical protein PTKIN_Ptkin09bG0233600 [Pterospermum kingtungense]
MVRTRENGIGASTRKRPTASEKRQRTQESDVELVVQDEDNIDELLEELLGPFPGGPVDASILKNFSTHVALNIWNGEERAPLKLVNHGQKLEKWVLNDNCLLIRAIVVQSGLASLLDSTYTVASSTIVSAFCERWQPETNTFHLPLDDLQAHEVCWEPYKADRDSHPLFEIAFFSGCIKCGSITEPYHAERILWQFGFIQSIPPEPLAPSKAIRGKTAKNYRVAYDQLDQIWNRRHMYVLLQESRGTPCTFPGECVPNYLSWYVQVSHPIIQNPARRCTSHSVSSSEMRIQRAVDVIKRAISIGSPNDVDVWRKAVFDVLRILTSEANASSSTGDENQAHEEKPKLT